MPLYTVLVADIQWTKVIENSCISDRPFPLLLHNVRGEERDSTFHVTRDGDEERAKRERDESTFSRQARNNYSCCR